MINGFVSDDCRHIWTLRSTKPERVAPTVCYAIPPIYGLIVS